ncbi:hypothetical protein PR048_025107 [Dryococelus australis]|uniref:Uncharacterized protein n=1 Tax=Dryococelus australis TaxID=614101 RepID=A0ABQ9GQG6_9NEOP|nr:hypothetical protein PR048_025107 [Dryococelus australis]
MAAEVEPFLKEFQSEDPLVPFLYSTLHSLLKSIIERFVKGDVIEKNELSKIDLGFATRDALRNAKSRERSRYTFLKTRLSFTVKIISTSPLVNNLLKSLTSLDLSVIDGSNTLAQQRINNLLEILVEKRWISGLLAEKVKMSVVLEEEEKKKKKKKNQQQQESVKLYRRDATCLDHFWMKAVESGELPNFTSLLKMVLILSHGNASVERDFPVNAECLVENQHEESLSMPLSVLDDAEKLLIEKSLIHSCRNAH